MKGFILNMFNSIVYYLRFAGRASLVTTGILITTVTLTYFAPSEVEFLTQSISLTPFHMAIYMIGGLCSIQVFITLWVKDYRNEYIPRWMLD